MVITSARCCKEAEYMSCHWDAMYLYDKHYPETNGFYEFEMAEDMLGTIG
jgi:hypothetical protein